MGASRTFCPAHEGARNAPRRNGAQTGFVAEFIDVSRLDIQRLTAAGRILRAKTAGSAEMA
jgi:hypothetical protein